MVNSLIAQPVIANPAGAMMQGAQYGHQMQEMRRQNALARAMQEHGPGLVAGDPAAYNAIAQVDPRAAMDFQKQHLGMDATRLGMDSTRLGMDATRQGMTIADERLELARRESEHKVAEWARQASAEERAATKAKLNQAMTVLELGGEAGFQQSVQQVAQMFPEEFAGVDLSQITYEALPQITALIVGAESGIEMAERRAPPKPADEYERYVQEEMAAGREPLSRIDYAQAKRGKGTVVYDPTTGRPLVSIGGGSDPTDVTSPSSPAAMISSIDGILNDPALDYSTGFLAWTQNIPGTDAKRFGARAKQLQGQAFLQAFESLKGGGHITEIEGQKATEAVGRLDTAQRADDYRQALEELRGLLEIGMQRQVGGTQEPSSAPQGLDFGSMGVTDIDSLMKDRARYDSLTPEQKAALRSRLQTLAGQ